MKRFIGISIIFVAVALMLTVGIWWWLQLQLGAVQSDSSVKPATQTEAETDVVSEVIGDTPVPLSDLELSEGQKNAIEKVGVDVDTFVITPAMMACAEAKLGIERITEIMNGDKPGVFESIQVAGCIDGE